MDVVFFYPIGTRCVQGIYIYVYENTIKSLHKNKYIITRGVTIHRYIDILYRECQRYAYRIVGACIDTHDISSSGRNQAIKCP